MGNNKIVFVLNKDDLNKTKSINKTSTKDTEKAYNENFTKLIKNIFGELSEVFSNSSSSGNIQSTAENLISKLTKSIVPEASGQVRGIINTSIAVLRELISSHTETEFEKQKQLIESINNKLLERNNLLEVAKALNSSILDSIEEQLSYQEDSAEILLNNLGFGNDIDELDTEELLSEYERINSKIYELKEAKNSLESDIADDNIFENIADWFVSLFGKSKEDKLALIESELESLQLESEQYEQLIALMEDINNLKQKEIKDEYKQKELKAQIQNDDLSAYQYKIEYYTKMIEMSEELGLSELERLELEKELSDTIKERFEYKLSIYDKEQELVIKKAKLTGASEEELNKLRLQAIDNMIDAKQSEIAEFGSTIDRETELIDLELERLALQKEINGELGAGNVLFDEQIRKQLRMNIEARKTGNSGQVEQTAYKSADILYNKGLSIEEINNLLGTEINPNMLNKYDTADDFKLPEFDGENILNNYQQAFINSPETNDYLEKEFREIRTQNEILNTQNEILTNINLNIIKNSRDTISNSKHSGSLMSSSSFLRMINELDRLNKK